MITLSIILTLVITTSFFIIRNLVQKNEQLEDFISKQSDAINACDQRLKQLDDKNIFYADDEIGFFFNQVMELQKILNEFNVKNLDEDGPYNSKT